MQLGRPTVLSEPLASVPALGAGTMVDRYEVLGLLGIGGIARVYRVRHRSLASLHALKVLALDRPSLRKRALQEGQVQASLRHPNLVPVTDIVDCDGAPALVLEYVAGPSLEQLLATRRLDLMEVDQLVQGVLRGVAHAHAHGVVHRDIKPGNILLEISGEELVPRVTDFGIAKLLIPSRDGMQTQAGTVMGTPPYMSPEQGLDASLVDATADVWALGMVLYEMLTGDGPQDPRPAEIYDTLRSHGVPRRMARAVDGALQVSAEARWTNAADMAKAWIGSPYDETMVAGARCSAGTMAVAYALRPRIRASDVEAVSTLRSRERQAWPRRAQAGLVTLALLTVGVAALFALWTTL